jgi:hypothetical protein
MSSMGPYPGGGPIGPPPTFDEWFAEKAKDLNYDGIIDDLDYDLFVYDNYGAAAFPMDEFDDLWGDFDDEFTDFFEYEEELYKEEFFDPAEGTFDDWLGSEDIIDWDGDGEFDESDYELLEWLYDENTDDLDGDGFFDEEDFFLSKWLDGPGTEDFNGDGIFNEDDFILSQEKEGVFENEIFWAYIEPGFNQAVIEWGTAEPGSIDSVFYRPFASSDWTLVTAASQQNFEHLITLTSLTPDTEYEIKIRSVSVEGFSSDYYFDGFLTRRDVDLRPVAIMNLDYETDVEEIFVFWETNRPTNARYEVKKISDGQMVDSDTINLEGDFVHDLWIDDLESGTDYEITVASAPVGLEGAASETVQEMQQTFNIRTRSDQIPISMIYPPNDIVSPNNAVISAEFNQSVRLRVDFARTDNFRANVSNSTNNSKIYKESISTGKSLKNHYLNLNNLKGGTNYRYRIVAFAANGDSFSTDPRGSNQWSFDWQFVTEEELETPAPAPEIIEGPEVFARDKIAVVKWVTDVETYGKVYYGVKGESYGTADEFSVSNLAPDGSPKFSQIHTINLAGLNAGTNYQFRIESTSINGKKVVFSPSSGSGKLAKTMQPPGGAGSFLTDSNPDTQLPVILNGPTVTSRTHNSAVVEWTTDEPANSLASFGTSTTNESVRSGENSAAHKLVLSNLASGTSYRFKVASTDAVGNGPIESVEGTFTTNAELDIVAPSIKVAPATAYKNDRSATIRWKTDEVATATIEFGLDNQLKTKRNSPSTGTAHEIALTNLTANTKYFYRVSSLDLNNNGPTKSAIDSFTTDAAADLTPPIISNIVTVARDSSTIIQWVTDELSDSFVEFGTDSLMLGDKIGDSKDEIEHEIVLTNLIPSTQYFFKAGSIDRANNSPSVTNIVGFTTSAGADKLPPEAPANLRATPGYQRVVLNWNANDESDLAGYNIYRRLADQEFTTVATRITDVTYIDAGLTNGLAYEYRVTAIDRASIPNESVSTDTVSSTPTNSAAPSAPNLVGARGRLSSPTLSFRNSIPFQVDALLTYTVQVSTDSLFQSVAASASGIIEGSESDSSGTTAWTVDRELADSTAFYWRVRAVEGDLSGPFSKTRQFVTVKSQPKPLLAGDFTGDNSVGFDDFFMFADNFGKKAEGDAKQYDLDNNGSVDFGDFFTFADNFGKSVPGKRWASMSIPLPFATFGLDTRAEKFTSGSIIEATLWSDDFETMQAFGAVIRYNEQLFSFEELKTPNAEWLKEVSSEEESFLRVVKENSGELAFGAALNASDLASDRTELASISFRVLRDAIPEDLQLVAGFIDQGDGKSRNVGNLKSGPILPNQFHLSNNFPNPFNPSTSIKYALPKSQRVTLTIYDVLGRHVKTLIDQDNHPAGFYDLTWNSHDRNGLEVATGVYFYVLEAETLRQVRKMMLLK